MSHSRSIHEGLYRVVLGLCAATGLAGFLICAPWVAVAPASASASSARSSEGPVEVERYWTGSRMRGAIPMSPVYPRLPLGGVDSSARGERAEVVPAQGLRRTSQRSEVVVDPESLPFRLHGKLFFQKWTAGEGWQDYVCSGSVVNSPSKRLVITAAHCLYGSRWSRMVMFVPAYQDGRAPFGEFTARRLVTPSIWTGREASWISVVAPSHDFGAVVLGGRVPIQRKLGGGFGIAFNVDRRNKLVTAYGYPEEPTATHPEYDGGNLVFCQSPWGGADRFAGRPSPGWISCDLSGGSSGGGWFFGEGILNSVNSYGYGSDWQRMYGPYFGRVASRLYQAVKRG